MVPVALSFFALSMYPQLSVASYDYYGSHGANPTYGYYNSVIKDLSYAYYASGSKEATLSDPAFKNALPHYVLRFAEFPAAFPGGFLGELPGLPGGFAGIPGVQGLPVQGLPVQGLPVQGLPGQGLPGQWLPGQWLPGQCVPGQCVPGHVPGGFPSGRCSGGGFSGGGFGGDGFGGSLGSKDGRPGIPLTEAQCDVVQNIVSQAIEGLRTTLQLLEQHSLQGLPSGDRFEQIFAEDLSHNFADEAVVKERLGMVLNMMTSHVNNVQFVYCPETDCKCDPNIGGCMIAYVVMFGELGVEDQGGFTVHLGQLWWGLPDTWAEKCKAGNLVHEFTHHVFHTVDEGYNFQHKNLSDDQKMRNAAAYENLVTGVMMAKERSEL